MEDNMPVYIAIPLIVLLWAVLVTMVLVANHAATKARKMERRGEAEDEAGGWTDGPLEGSEDYR